MEAAFETVVAFGARFFMKRVAAQKPRGASLGCVGVAGAVEPQSTRQLQRRGKRRPQTDLADGTVWGAVRIIGDFVFGRHRAPEGDHKEKKKQQKREWEAWAVVHDRCVWVIIMVRICIHRYRFNMCLL
jgi:hypothetical protein